ncbi:MAG: FecR family protein [Methylococcales bacterium]|nr:FecR family protein [Methylococcales bacterium]
MKTKSNSIHQQASFWLTRLQSHDCTEEERRDFSRWLLKKPAHAQAYQDVQNFWQNLNSVEPLINQELTAARHYLQRPPAPPRLFSPRLALAFSVILMMGISPYLYFHATTQTYQTAKGERQTVQLADGSQIILNTDTQLNVHYGFMGREVNFIRGEALFSVVHNDKKPFTVAAAKGVIEDVGTRFNVYQHDNQVAVTVLEGEVQITTSENPTPRHIIAGLQTSYNEQGQIAPLEKTDVNSVTAWQTGKLIFKKQPLRDVLAQLARYHDVELQLSENTPQNLSVSGTFPADNLSLALNTIASALPIKFTKMGERTVLVSGK